MNTRTDTPAEHELAAAHYSKLALEAERAADRKAQDEYWAFRARAKNEGYVHRSEALGIEVIHNIAGFEICFGVKGDWRFDSDSNEWEWETTALHVSPTTDLLGLFRKIAETDKTMTWNLNQIDSEAATCADAGER